MLSWSPRTTNQDDVENYFSFAKKVGLLAGNPLSSNTWKAIQVSLQTLLIKAEKKELDKNTFVGFICCSSDSKLCFSVPLKRKKKLNYSNISSNVLHVPNGYDNLDDGCLSFNESEVENFHTQKDEQQLYRQAEQVLDIINIKSP
ncbi:hypothetical protein OS493_037645, partial [Desmophyllum pertusum]